MKVKEVMTKDVKTLSPEINAKQALDMLFDLKISGLPVVDKNDKLIGMFTEKEILKSVLPSYLDKVGSFIYEENPKGIKNKARDLEKLKVENVMRRDVITVGEEVALCEVARIMLTQKVRRAPVVNKEGRVIGIVAREDVVKALVGRGPAGQDE